MPRFRVRGAVRETGAEIATTVAAQSESDAIRFASERGIVVSSLAIEREDPSNLRPLRNPPPTLQPGVILPADGPPIVCANPNCGYRGPSHKRSKGSAVLLVILFLFFILPAIIYLVMRGGYEIICPACGAKIRDERR